MKVARIYTALNEYIARCFDDFTIYTCIYKLLYYTSIRIDSIVVPRNRIFRRERFLFSKYYTSVMVVV